MTELMVISGGDAAVIYRVSIDAYGRGPRVRGARYSVAGHDLYGHRSPRWYDCVADGTVVRFSSRAVRR